MKTKCKIINSKQKKDVASKKKDAGGDNQLVLFLIWPNLPSKLINIRCYCKPNIPLVTLSFSVNCEGLGMYYFIQVKITEDLNTVIIPKRRPLPLKT